MKRDAAAFAASLLLFLTPLAAPAFGAPTHPPLPPPFPGAPLDHSCGIAVDSQGDAYLASAGEGKIKVFDPARTELTSIENPNEPCGLAVDTKGSLYVSEASTGNVVKYVPNAYPFSGTPTYGSPTMIDSSGKAKSISVDSFDDRLYVARGDHIAAYNPDGSLGIDEVQLVNLFENTGGSFRLAMPGEGSAARNEIQRIGRHPQADGGTFTLTFDSQTTAPIPYDATAVEIQTALEALSTIGAGDVSVVGSPVGTRGWWVEFTGALAKTDVALISGDGEGLTGTPNKEIEVRALSDITAQIPYGAEASAVKAELEQLESIGAGNVAVSPAFSDDYLVTFVGKLAGTDVEMLAGDPSGLLPDDRKSPILISESVKDFSGHIGEGALTNATGVVPYTYLVFKNEFEVRTDRYLFVADDAASDALKVLSSPDIRALQLRKTITTVDHDADPETPEQPLGFGASGARLAADPGNRSAEGKCAQVADQACTAGHLFLYDDAHKRIEEFEATGQHLTGIELPEGFTDAKPTAISVDRSGGAGDGTIFATSGAAAGAEVIAFGPLTAPSRPPRAKLSFEEKSIREVAIDRFGTRYVAVDSTIFAYNPTENTRIAIKGPNGEEGLANEGTVNSLAVDSECNLYALDRGDGFSTKRFVYFAPAACPPQAGTKYEAPVTVATQGSFSNPESTLSAVGINPANDHAFVATAGEIMELGAAKAGSGILDPAFAAGLGIGNIEYIAVHGASGRVYVGMGSGRGEVAVVEPGDPEDAGDEELVARITGVGSPQGPFVAASGAIAVDQSNGHVLIFHDKRGVAQEFDASGAFVAEFGTFAQFGAPIGIAIDNSGTATDGNVYVAFDDPNPEAFDLTAFGPLAYGEPPIVVTGTASEVGGGKATLNGTVNPRGVLLEECRFEHLTEAAYRENEEEGKELFEGAESTPCAETPEEIGSGTETVPVHAEIGGLDPEGRYRFRLAAKNKYGEDKGDPGLFGPPLPTIAPARPISYTEATLRATIDPSGLATTYRFEYGTDEAYGQSTATAEIPASAGPTEVAVPIFDLAEGTLYRFRLIAENEAKAVALEGPDQTFETLERLGVPPCPNAEYRTGRSAALPDCRAYELVTPADTRGSLPYTSSAGFNNWLVTPRGAGAGESLAYFIDGTLPGFDGNGLRDGYRALRAAGPHPEEGWRNELFSPSYSEAGGGPPTPRGIAADQSHSLWIAPALETFEGTLARGSYLRTPAGFEPLGQGSLGTDLEAEGRFVTAAGAHVIFSSQEHLEPQAPPAGTEAIYDRGAGAASAQLVSLLPGEITPAAGQDAGFVGATEDGSAIAFDVGGSLYVRRGGEETVKVTDSPYSFAGLSQEGERIFYAAFNSPSILPAGLFAFDLEAQTKTQIAPESIFVNVSADGQVVYFTSELQMGGKPGPAVAQPNLYIWDGTTETIRFIAVLDPQDMIAFGTSLVNLLRWIDAVAPTEQLIGRGSSPTRSTPDGEVLVFQSHAQLTSYDNTETSAAACGDPKVAGERCGEVYRYDVSSDSLLCVSCDPTGAPPSGDGMLQDPSAESPVLASTLLPNVTDDGRAVFFASPDPLLPEDANAVKDVYEWKAQGGGCKRQSGCLALISSGQSENHNYLYGMSADGRDVFFSTLEKLHGQDIPGSASIYDARAEGGIPDPPKEEECQGDACQGQGTPPPALPTPTSTGTGGENLKRKPRCPKGKRKVRRGGKVRCVKRRSKVQRKRHHSRSGRAGR